jgi:two-component system nitrogen regulation response regulator GlnG
MSTGKELVARAIYQHGPRSRGPFLALNCAAIPETLLEGELFGHERGAFTGAERRRIGKFEQCNGGTLFLDEIGDMPLLTQTKVLRVLQEQTFQRLGSNETVKTDVRLLAATNQNLEARVDEGRFRLDLFYRLRGFSIHLPPLRERGDDVILLVNHYRRRFNRELGRDVTQIAPEAMEMLRQYPWPGNARELQGVLKQALLQTTGSLLLPDFLPVSLKQPREAEEPTVPTAALLSRRFVAERLAVGTHDLYEEALAQMEKALFSQVLEHTGGNQLQAARILGISRSRLRKRLRELGITITPVVEGDEVDDE